MSNSLILRNILLLFAVLLLLTTCKKDGKVDNSSISKAIQILTAIDIRSIDPPNARCGGTITSEISAASIKSRGVCWSTDNNPTIANDTTINSSGKGSFVSIISKLNDKTIYYVRAYAIVKVNAVKDTVYYGNTIPFTTWLAEDQDGNVFHRIKINDQWWMAENLQTTRYRNKENIPNVTDSLVWWRDSTSGAYCNYNNIENNAKIFGCLYNWSAVNDARKLCPEGWHIPTKNEWAILFKSLGSADIAGAKMKETGTILDYTSSTGISADVALLWNNPNTGATNESGFTALPAGDRFFSSSYDSGLSYFGAGRIGGWWAAEDITGTNSAWYNSIYYESEESTLGSFQKNVGLSVRCVMD